MGDGSEPVAHPAQNASLPHDFSYRFAAAPVGSPLLSVADACRTLEAVQRETADPV